MRRVGESIRGRLILGATLVLMAFVAATGWAVQRAHADSVRAGRFAQLQNTVYLLLAGAEVDASGTLVMPESFPAPRLSLPDSGLYASVRNLANHQEWQSASTVTVHPPFLRQVAVGEWRFETLDAGGGSSRAGAAPLFERLHASGDAGPTGRGYLAVGYGVQWAAGQRAVPLVVSVLEDRSELDSEVAVFERTLWTWLGGSALLLLLSQAALLQWGLSPLRRVAQEIRRIELGEQEEVAQRYPAEIAALTGNLNTLIRQERLRQARYKEALSFLSHSLKTPLAVLRAALDRPAQLPGTVAEQVSRMDAIVQHQLARAAARGAGQFTPLLRLRPVLLRVRDALAKVHAERQLQLEVDCADDLEWRIDEGDAFELFGNLMDNASKWTTQRVSVRVVRDGQGLAVRVDDDGPGFGSDARSLLQLHVRADEQVPGHGVGLAVVDALVSSHHGALTLARSDWGGARVEILLPPP